MRVAHSADRERFVLTFVDHYVNRVLGLVFGNGSYDETFDCYSEETSLHPLQVLGDAVCATLLAKTEARLLCWDASDVGDGMLVAVVDSDDVGALGVVLIRLRFLLRCRYFH